MKSLKRKAFILLLLTFTGSVQRSFCQNTENDTLIITIPDAENQFLAKNLQLLAQKCNIDAAKAQIIQAGLWDNPTLTVEQNIYNFETKKAFDASYTGNTAVSVEQLFLLAGKRNKRVSLEKINTEREESVFYDLIRTLQFELRSDFWAVFYLTGSASVYDLETSSLKRTIEVFREQYKNGYVSLKEIVRLEALLFSLENEKRDLQSQIEEHEANLRLLLYDHHRFILPIAPELPYRNVEPANLSVETLVDSALQDRFDLHEAELNVSYAKQNLAYQKSLAVPDFTGGLIVWDRAGSYVSNYNALTLQMNLPFFNRNQGSVKTARSLVDNNNFNLENFRETVRNDVLQAYFKTVRNDRLFKDFDTGFKDDFRKMIDEIAVNYQKRNISMLEFIDYYDAYKESILKMNSLENERTNAFDELNYTIGKSLIR